MLLAAVQSSGPCASEIMDLSLHATFDMWKHNRDLVAGTCNANEIPVKLQREKCVRCRDNRLRFRLGEPCSQCIRLPAGTSLAIWGD